MGADDAVQAAAGAAAVVGHVFPVWLKFRGGKGVAAAAVYALAVWITRYVSVGSIVASLLLPLLAYLANASPPVVASSIGVAMLVLYRHRANVSRLQSGNEWKLGHRV